MIDVEQIAVFLIQDPIALAVHVYHMTKWTEEGRENMPWDERKALITEHFNLTELEMKKALDYLDKCGIG